jgi:hypothetical protein
MKTDMDMVVRASKASVPDPHSMVLAGTERRKRVQTKMEDRRYGNKLGRGDEDKNVMPISKYVHVNGNGVSFSRVDHSFH